MKNMKTQRKKKAKEKGTLYTRALQKIKYLNNNLLS